MPSQSYHCPRWAQLPNIPLYLDQMVMVITDTLGFFSAEGESPVTKTMINNYVKQKIVKPPEGKKYSRSQTARLIQVSWLKRVFSIAEVNALLTMLDEKYGEEAGYDLFCERLEFLLGEAFGNESFAAKTKKMPDDAAALLDVALLALVSKLRVQSGLPAAETAEKPKEKEKQKAKQQKEKPGA